MHDRFDEAWMSGGEEAALASRENELMLLFDVPPDQFEGHLESQIELASNWKGFAELR